MVNIINETKVKYLKSLIKQYNIVLGTLYIELSSPNTRSDEEDKEIIKELETTKKIIESLQVIVEDYNQGIIK